MITENLSTLKIHKLTQAQYDRELAAGNIDENALYLTPDELASVEVSLLASNWYNNKQTINLDIVTANNSVFVSPEPSEANYLAYIESGIRCVSQDDGQITFGCIETPIVDLLANIVVY